MAITLIEYSKKKPNTRYHPERGIWIGYKINVRVGGKRHRTGPFATRRDAETFIERLKANDRDVRAGLPVQKLNVPKVSEYLEKHLTALKKHPETVRGRRVFSEFTKLLNFDIPVTSLRRSHFQEYINARLSTGVKPVTVAREVAMLSIAFHNAPALYPKELEDYEPPKIPRPPLPRKKKKRYVVTEEDKNAIAGYLYSKNDAFSVRIGLMVEIAWYLGLRYSEVLNLEKSNYSKKKNRLTADRTKTDDLTDFDYLPERVKIVIERAIGLSGDPVLIFPRLWTYGRSRDKNNAHEATIYPPKFYKLMREAVEAAGLEYSERRSNPMGVSFHSLRHSFVTRLMQVTDLATTQSFSSHSDESMVMLYSHATDRTRELAMQKLYGANGSANLEEIFEKIRNSEIDLAGFEEWFSGSQN